MFNTCYLLLLLLLFKVIIMTHQLVHKLLISLPRGYAPSMLHKEQMVVSKGLTVKMLHVVGNKTSFAGLLLEGKGRQGV